MNSSRGAVGNVYYRYGGVSLLHVCFGKVKTDARSDQPITFTRCLNEALTINYPDVPSAAHNQACVFQLSSSIRDAWPLDAQHFGEQVLCDLQCVVRSE